MDVAPEPSQGKDLQLGSSLSPLSKTSKPNDISKKNKNQPIRRQLQHLSNEISPSNQSETLMADSHGSPANQSAPQTTRLGLMPSWVSAGTPSLLPVREDPPKGASSISILGELQEAFRAQTEQWFQLTQAPRIIHQGELPDWFHGFISRREAEERLKNKPLGCFLVRFCESRVGFVLSYRGTERCRHFVLNQLQDERYVILGEQSAHNLLQDLLQHYHTLPIPPFDEFLTTVCSKSSTLPVRAEILLSDKEIPTTQSNNPPANKDHPSKAPLQPSFSLCLEAQPLERTKSFMHQEAPNCIPPVSGNIGPVSAAHGSSSTLQREIAAVDYTQVNKTRAANCLEPSDKYTLLMKFHTYAEPTESKPQETHVYHLPHEPPIDFYAMGRGSIMSTASENIYSEVDIRHLEIADPSLPEETRASLTTPLPVPAPRHIPNGDSTLPPGLSLDPSATEVSLGQSLVSGLQTQVPSAAQFDDPVYARETGTRSGSEIPDNIYERIAKCSMPRKLPLPKRH
uniref:SH2 domain-containing protein 2A n=1 Tax=Geotrypetes seraphini TaxID=260995 RepID=A0A6P8PXS4_GEOSA|nr:SH2 domain-containing protein 2A [Geotrypetes seraphini]